MSAAAPIPVLDRIRADRTWRLLRLATMTERAYRVRLLIAPITLAVQLFLFSQLWAAVYVNTGPVAGLDERQTVTYALMALLITRIRWNGQRDDLVDSVSVCVHNGTIGYWFLRPISPARFTMWRQAGESLYGGLWAVLGYLVLVWTGTIAGWPRNGALFMVSLVLGQVILYYLSQLVEISMFWLLRNSGIVRMYYFLQGMLSGAFVPLPFLPESVSSVVVWLPFGLGVNTPLAIYVGLVGPSAAILQVGAQIAWVVALAVTLRILWARASRRVVVHGG